MKKISDEKIIEALLKHDTQAAAAKALGITPQTIVNRMKKPSFVAKYHSTQNEILRSVTRKLANASGKSADLLIRTLEDEEAPLVLRLGLAKDILKMSRDYISVDELQRRISQLEVDQLSQPIDENVNTKNDFFNMD